MSIEQFSQISSIVHNEFYIKSGVGPTIQRNIFENVPYDEYENSQIELLKAKISEKGLTIAFKKSTLLKMLMAAQYDLEKAILNCKMYRRFLKEYKKMDYSKDLSKGYIYVCGFDNQFRPVIVFRNKCDIRIISYVLESVKRQLLIDYYVENWTILIDLELDLPTLELADLQSLQLNFYGNLNKIFIVNGPEDINTILKEFIQKFPDLTVKLQVITDFQQLQKYIPKEQLELRYGGELENVTQFWPLIKRDLQGFQKNSHLSLASLNSSSVNKKSSFMKITVLEENGNQLLNQQLEVYEDQIEQSSESNLSSIPKVQENEEKYKIYLTTSTKKQNQDVEQPIDMNEAIDEENFQESNSKKYQKNKGKQKIKKQPKIILEGEKETKDISCCSKKCQIF